MASSNQDTPLMRQYHSVKERYADCLLFFRMGDFYELFFEDAKKAAHVLEIALTSRNKNSEEPVPMCGVPHHSASGYIQKLVANGFKVAVCEQLEEAQEGKGIVRRDVVRVITPGTRLELDWLDAKKSCYTHAAVLERGGDRSGKISWACCDFSTGHFFYGTSHGLEAWRSLLQMQNPSEIIVPLDKNGRMLEDYVQVNLDGLFIQTVPDFYFDLEYASQRVQDQFDTKSAQALSPNMEEKQLCAVGSLIRYFQETQKLSRIPTAHKLNKWGSADTMELDSSVIEALDLLNDKKSSKDVSLLKHLDETKTPMGARLLRERMLSPLISPHAIEQRLDEIDACLELNQELVSLAEKDLSEIYDIERLLARISLFAEAAYSSSGGARELRSLAYSVLKTADFYSRIKKIDVLSKALNQTLGSDLISLSNEILNCIQESTPPGIKEGNLFNRGYSTKLDELIELTENGQKWLVEYELKERQSTQINSLKVRYNNVFGYYIEITKANLKSVPTHYVRKQTMVGAERFITEELKNFEEKILTAEKKRSDLEYELFVEYCCKVMTYSSALLELSEAIAAVDVVFALTKVAREFDYIRPSIESTTDLEIRNGRHPTVEAAMRRSGKHDFIPNDLSLTTSHPFLLITGPNMGGKSTVMRQSALIVLMAQMGSFVPASFAKIGIVDRIFTRVGASDNLAQGASTFMVEMNEVSFILRQATKRSLILLDEVGRGTSTYDGVSLAWAICEDILTRVNCRTLFATHYHELTSLSQSFSNIQNGRVAVAVSNTDQGSTVRFLYKLEPGSAERSYGILVARLAGLPKTVLTRAEEILIQLENENGAKLEQTELQANAPFMATRTSKSKPKTPLNQLQLGL